MIINKLKGFTLIEMITTLVIASAFSLGLFFVFLNANKSVTNEELIYDIRNNDELIVNAIFSMVIGITLWIFANDILLTGMGSLVILVMAFLARLDCNNSLV